MDLNRKRAVACGAACAATASSSLLLDAHHVSNAWSFLSGFGIGLSIVLAVAFFVKSRRTA